jgi:hypothetical protein
MGIAGSLSVMLVPIVDRGEILCVRIHNNKERCRPKMVIYGAVNPFVVLNRKTNLHVPFLFANKKDPKKFKANCIWHRLYRFPHCYFRNTSRMTTGSQLSIFIKRIKIRITTGM